MGKTISKICLVLSLVTLVVAALDFMFKMDILNLAGTQWILVSILLAIYAMVSGGCPCSCCEKGKE